MFAVLAGILGDAQGDELGVLSPVRAQVVAPAFGGDEVGEQAHDGGARLLAVRVVEQGVEHIEQRLATVDQLLQALQVEGQADARAVACGAFADAFAALPTLVEQDAQVFVVADQGGRLAPRERIRVDVGDQLGVLRGERRFVLLQRRVEAQQLRVHAAGRDPERNDAQGAQNLRGGMRQGGAGRGFFEMNGCDQLEPGGFAEPRDPAGVGRVRENPPQAGAQAFVVEGFGQQFVADAAKKLGEETSVRQDAGRGVQVGVPGFGAQAEDGLAHGAAQVGARLEQMAQRAQPAFCVLQLVRILRAQFGNEQGEQIGGVGVVIFKTVEEYFHANAVGNDRPLFESITILTNCVGRPFRPSDRAWIQFNHAYSALARKIPRFRNPAASARSQPAGFPRRVGAADRATARAGAERAGVVDGSR